MKIRTFCNPVNINYQYQRGFYGRESADPAIVLYKDKYFLFASHGSGYWISDDLVKWDFILVDLKKQPEFALYAPGVCVVGDRMYITHSQGGSILYSDDPFDPDSWVIAGRPYEWHDPAFLFDDDGYVYIYEGLGDKCLHASKLDPNDNMRMIEGPVPIFYSDYKNRGYDRCGDNNEIERMPSLEGGWVNKINGKYYLTYATPGTEFSTYCDGVAVSDHPMGPFENCDNSPTVFKSTGFMRGAGHGCLFEDKHGNLWKIDTVSISVNHLFERRLALFPAKIIDGRLYTNTLRGDYPMILPHDVISPFDEADAGMQLLSFKSKAEASSTLDAGHSPDLAFDENMKTWWSATTGDPGEYLCADLGDEYGVFSVQVNFADQDAEMCEGRGNGFSYKYTLEVSDDGLIWRTAEDRRDNEEDFSHEYFQFEKEEKFRYIKLTNHGKIPANGRFAVSGLRVFGSPAGPLPSAVSDFSAIRHEDERDMTVSWDPVLHADGYFVRFGVNKDELYTQYQITDGCKAEIRSLIRGVKYYITVDAYGKGGVTKSDIIKTV